MNELERSPAGATIVIMGKRRTFTGIMMGLKRQVKEVCVYTNDRVAKQARLQQTAVAADLATETDHEGNGNITSPRWSLKLHRSLCLGHRCGRSYDDKGRVFHLL